MYKTLLSDIDPSVICLVLFVLMLFSVSMGNRLRKVYWNPEEGEAKGGVNSLLGALFGIWSFILAFSFNQAGGRFQTVQEMILDEGNILRNTILKADFFPDSLRDAYRVDLRKYLEERIIYYDDANDAKASQNREDLSKTAKALWTRTIELSKKPDTSGPAGDMAGSLGDLFDIGIKREALLSAGMPVPIATLLYILALSICLAGGFTTPVIKRKEWILISIFALLACTILYITIDLSRPMQGLIRPDIGQEIIVNLRKLF